MAKFQEGDRVRYSEDGVGENLRGEIGTLKSHYEALESAIVDWDNVDGGLEVALVATRNLTNLTDRDE